MGKVSLEVTMGMVVEEFAQVGLMIVGKLVICQGMSNLVFVFYSNALASLILLPCSFLFHRSDCPPLTLSVLSRLFFLGLLGFLIYAVLVHKFLGMLGFTIAHQLLARLYLIFSLGLPLYLPLYSSIYVKKFPAELMVLFFYFFFVSIQSAILCLVMERNPNAWSLNRDMRLPAVLYSAFIGSTFQVGICTWCLRRSGPVFVAMFKPLGIVIALVVGIIFFEDTLYLGSLVGSTVIVTGFYLVI